jgi:pyrroline-5-carboxylate reductase
VEKKIERSAGFIGLGNMGNALLMSLLKNNFQDFNKYYIFDIDEEKMLPFKTTSHISICSSVQEVVNSSDFVLIAVKPQFMQIVLDDIKKTESSHKVFITIAAGLQVAFYKKTLGKEYKIVRVMPNTPYLVGEGAAGITLDDRLDDESRAVVKAIFEQSGRVILCDEKYLDVVTGLSGSGPAYIFIIIEALADGAVKMGLPRKQAMKLAAQTVVGAGKMVRDTEIHPGELKDMVCSPGGTSIEAISVLERAGLRSTLIDAVEAATIKSKSFHS